MSILDAAIVSIDLIKYIAYFNHNILSKKYNNDTKITKLVYLIVEGSIHDNFSKRGSIIKRKDDIIRLRGEGKSYGEIQSILGCSKGAISYHIGQGQKLKNYNRQLKHRKGLHPYHKKIETFCQEYIVDNSIIEYKKQSMYTVIRRRIETFSNHVESNNMRTYKKPTFKAEDVIEKFGESPTCYLTGQTIDYNKTRTYEFDHKIPRSKGGDSSIDNLGICTKQANQSKRDMTPEELMEFCKRVLENNGYKVEKVPTPIALDAGSTC